MKYYNFNIFHSVQRSFMAQTGDPSGTGTGGQSVFGHMQGEKARFFEMESHPRIKHKKKGSISMVNNGSNQHGSQFFITLREDIDYLDGIHTVFGVVTEGFDVLDKISETFCDAKHRPLQDIRINHTVILDDPFDDPEGLEFPDKSPEIDPYKLKSDRIAADEDIGKEKEKTTEQVEEETQTQEAKANAQILEMIGDLPDAYVKPPENVLFVCKLNPVTSSEDLQIIFSRFGKINSCEVIKDQATGDSLCYSFVEFEREEDCEEAYFKMDNVLIDDRRIHVDFSQSVAKLQFKGKGPVMPQRPSKGQSSQRPRDARNPRFPDNRNVGRGNMQREDLPSRKPKERRRRDVRSSSNSSSSSPDREKSKERDKARKRGKKRSKDSSSSPERSPPPSHRERSKERERFRDRGGRNMSEEHERTVKRRDDRSKETKRNDRNKREGGQGKDDRDQERRNERINERSRRSNSRDRSHDQSHDQSSSRRRVRNSGERYPRNDSHKKKGMRTSSESSDSSTTERRKSQKRRESDSSDEDGESRRMTKKKTKRRRDDEERSPKRKPKKKRRSRSLSS
ncbi:peptidyl-prolyl cis-trans isomerase-like 4 isoform X2 [Apostichopus japonicus]